LVTKTGLATRSWNNFLNFECKTVWRSHDSHWDIQCKSE
jgi:hypothetical protein